MPAVIEWPARIRQPRASDVNTGSSDIFTTLCELAGLAAKMEKALRAWQQSVLRSLTGADYR